jgi:phosphatidate cytidylyltransferase
MLKRTLVVLILLPIGLVIIWLGGWVFSLLVVAVLGMAGWEYTQVFRKGGHQTASWLVVAGCALIAASRAWDIQQGKPFNSAPALLSLIILSAMTVHLVAFERGREAAASDFAVTLGGMFYIGWLGAYLISLRGLEDGIWWLLLVLPCVWIADSAAYMVGSRIGKHKMTPRLSPKKSWEGYLAGVLFGTLGGALLAAAFQAWAGVGAAFTPLNGALLGLALSTLTTLGDLGESMIKRQFGVKDSGKLLPGHGGVFDRIDSWLWAAVIGYYMITLAFI